MSLAKVAGLCSAMCIGVLLGVSPASARDLPAGGMTATEIADWLKQKGYTGTVKPDPSTPGDQIVSSAVNGIEFDIYLYGCTGSGDARRCNAMQYASGWSGNTAQSLSLDKINDWDHEKRYIRAYKTNGTVFGEYDIDISPGGTYEMLDKSLTRWDELIGKFKTYMGL